MNLVSEAQHAAERAVIGYCLTWTDRVADVDLQPEHFTSTMWRAVWTQMRSFSDAGQEFDLISLADAMRADHGEVPLSELTASIEDAGLVHRHAELLRTAHTTREVVLACSGVIAAAKAGTGGAELLSDAMAQVSAITVGDQDDSSTIGELVGYRFRDVVQALDDKKNGVETMRGIPTGLEDLDGILGGFQRGIVTVAAGRPGMGKSAFAMACTDNASAAGVGVHVFSLEDTRGAYTDRALARAGKIDAEKMRTYEFTAGDLQNLTIGAQNLKKRAGWIVDDRSAITASEIVRSVRRKMKRNSTALVVVDYITILKREKGQDKREMIDDAMNTFADAAKRDNMAYLVLAQLNRNCESREDKRPMLSDLKESGAIEERAKAVIMVYRPVVYDHGAPAEIIEFLIRKNNQGQTGLAMGKFDASRIRVH